MTGRRLLILKCSARKCGGPEFLPAIERYDGPLWRVLRSYLRRQPLFAADLDVYALSAAFGLIPADQPIPWYNQTMAPERADELRPAVLRAFADLMAVGYSTLCLGLSQRYLRAMEGWPALVPSGTAVTLTNAPMGAKLGQLRSWLAGEAWPPPDTRPVRLAAPAHPPGRARLAGVEIALTCDEALRRARAALGTDQQAASRYRDWYVLIDDRPVAPKWLASVLAGRPTSAFDAGAARRLLLALGLDVERASQA